MACLTRRIESEETTVTKLKEARRQIETAIELWVREADPVSIHTLAAAAHRLVHDVAASDKEIGISGAFLLDGKRLAEWGFNPKEFKKELRRAETFFKHAKDDPNDSYTLSHSLTEAVLYSTIDCYRRLVKEKSALMGLFLAWFGVQSPALLDEPSRDKLANIIPASKGVSRQEFFEKMNPLALLF